MPTSSSALLTAPEPTPVRGAPVVAAPVAAPALSLRGVGKSYNVAGRQNGFLNGAFIGMRRAEIRQRFDEIVEFSGVEAFLDTPIKRYSSGMAVRLAFAVAAHLDADILLVDEVLAVGDQAFQEKCL